MTKKRKLLIFYDWFYPGFKAGGPIQSLTNLAIALASEFEIFVTTSAYDLNSEIPYHGVIVNAWNDVALPASSASIKVFYATKKSLTKEKVQTIFKEVLPDIVYLNGIFSYHFFLLPLVALKKAKKEIRVVVCPRGMLKQGALSGKAFKKKIYIGYLRLSGLLKKVYWHGTTPAEQEDICIHFPKSKGTFVAPNIPKKPLKNILSISKPVGELRLVYLSLINEHKNLLLLLEILEQIKTGVSLNIYGPVVDKIYWKRCLEKVDEMGGKVQYMGTIDPALVQDMMSQFHGLILLTKGENFGHAIYESLSVGRPVITSTFTPWQNLYENRAGANVSLEKNDSISGAINAFLEMEQDEYSTFCNGAYAMATNYYRNVDAERSYKNMFI